MSLNIAIWVLVVIVAAVAIFVIRLLHQLTNVATETELTMRNVNSQIPRMIDKADKVLENADLTMDRVNRTLDDLEMPINLVKSASGIFGDPRRMSGFGGGGQNALAFIAGFKIVKTIFEQIKKRIAKRHGKNRQD
jgi:molybdopterin converting factor small subunit